MGMNFMSQLIIGKWLRHTVVGFVARFTLEAEVLRGSEPMVWERINRSFV